MENVKWGMQNDTQQSCMEIIQAKDMDHTVQKNLGVIYRCNYKLKVTLLIGK